MRHRLIPIASLVLTFAGTASANVGFTGSYTQNFNGMALGTTTPADWFVGGRSGTDGLVDASGNGAITGTTVQVDNGSVAAGSGTIGNYNYGPGGNGSARSLGSIATTALGHRAIEVRINNNTGAAMGAFEFHFDGKQWRVGDASGAQALVMKYSTDGINFSTMGTIYDFYAIQTTTPVGTAIDGETIRLNRLGGMFMPPSAIPNNGTFYLRWFDFNDASVADHGLAIDAFTISNPQPSGTSVYTFVDGVNGYTGTVDTYLQQSAPMTDFSGTTPIKWDGEDGGGVDYMLLRFDNIFGTNPGQIQPTDTVTSATITYTVDGNVSSNPNSIGNDSTVNEIVVDWPLGVTFNTFGGEPDVQVDEYGTQIGTAAGGTYGQQSLDVTSSIVAWKTNPTANKGWIFRPNGTDGTQITSRENSVIGLRPRLTVLLNGGAPPQKTLTIKYQPYLQLGNAPLQSTGAGIGTTDQMVIAWQTVESGSGLAPDDYFEVDYRKVGDVSYIPVTPVNVLDTLEETRVNRSVTITGLNYDDDYEYRVFHKRNPSTPVLVNTYPGTFHTRKAPSSLLSFSFATYGDSADKYSGELPQAESVNARIATMNLPFVMLLGDNIYPSGTHQDMDARFEGAIVPTNSAYIRNHIQYFCMGNHDAGYNNGKPSLDDFYCPIPALGITSPVAAPVGETAEKNYSFDYGMVHFTVIDSTAWGDPGSSASRQTNIANWMAADLGASNQPWKIVAAHHPPKSLVGHSDTGNAMACDIFPIMIANGADMLLVGHSHNYQRSFPLTGHSASPGCSGGDVTWIADQSGAYIKGAQTFQVLAGTGGKNVDGPAPTSATQWLAKSFGNNNGGGVGPFVIDVTPTQLTCKYILASNGSIKDQFTISVPGPQIAVAPPSIARSVHIGDPLSDSTFTVRNGGIGTITYDIVDDAAWLSVDPDDGTSTGENDTITVSFDTSTLKPAGIYSGTITISAPEAANSPVNVPVTVTVTSVKPDFDGDGDVDQIDYAFLQNCFTGNAVSATGNCTRADIESPTNGDVYSGDVTAFLACMSGANVMADPNCD